MTDLKGTDRGHTGDGLSVHNRTWHRVLGTMYSVPAIQFDGWIRLVTPCLGFFLGFDRMGLFELLGILPWGFLSVFLLLSPLVSVHMRLLLLLGLFGPHYEDLGTLGLLLYPFGRWKGCI